MESPELPVICTKSVKVNDSQPAFSQNLLLRENAIYIRAKAPIESREISSIQEWRDLIDRLLEKGKKELLRKMPCAKFISEQEEVLEAAEGAKVVGIEDYEAQLKRETR
ncbi:MAG: hypothetical protein NT030_07795 [Candidatus Saganbacteria bacterium]|nr:hypothetical protein [Candidatus Saganbacteria bacterium]